MILIKRYPNRKYYDTEARRYISLEAISQIIRQGGEVRVVDHASGEDLTAKILMQIIYEQEKKQRDFMPLATLAEIIRSGGERLNPMRRSLALSRDFLQAFEQEARRRIQLLISQGEVLEGEGMRLLEKLLAFGDLASVDRRPQAEEVIERILAARQTPSRAEFEQLQNRLDQLSARLDAWLIKKSADQQSP